MSAVEIPSPSPRPVPRTVRRTERRSSGDSRRDGAVAATTRILLVEDDEADAYILRKIIHDEGAEGFVLIQAELLGRGLEMLAAERFDLVLLDLDLPDSGGIETFRKVHREVSGVPIIVLSGLDDEQVAVAAVREGAQDYLVKGKVDGQLLVRAMRYAIERHQMQEDLRSLSLTDDLTGLHNRRGFQALAEQQLKLAQRTGATVTLIFADLDGLKAINDTLGHDAGNRALVEAAEILRRCFRESDIIARLGGDEFVVLLIETAAFVTDPTDRVRRQVAKANQRGDREYTLAMSLGLSTWIPDHARTLDELIRVADQAMYEEKRAKKAARDEG